MSGRGAGLRDDTASWNRSEPGEPSQFFDSMLIFSIDNDRR